MYFRGHMPSKGEYSFALTVEPDTSLRYGIPMVKLVARRYIERILRQPGNSHLLENENVLGDLTKEEFGRKAVVGLAGARDPRASERDPGRGRTPS